MFICTICRNWKYFTTAMDVYVVWISSGNNWLWQHRLKCFCLYCKARNYNKLWWYCVGCCHIWYLKLYACSDSFPFWGVWGLLPEVTTFKHTVLPNYLWLEAYTITFLSSNQVNNVKGSGNYVLPPELAFKILFNFPHSEFIFLWMIRIRNFYSPQQHLLASIHNGGTVLLVWSRTWIFNYSLDQFCASNDST